MKKLLLSITLSVCSLISMPSFAAIEACQAPSDGDWTNYCSCFVEQALKTCDSCPAVACMQKTEAWLKRSIHHATPTIISWQCTNQINSDTDNNCVAPGVDQNLCESSVADYKEHCF